MLENTTQVQVRYAETDMMGIVYHANYLTWLEIGRTELLRDEGLPYKDIEAMGLLLPVLEVEIKYRRPAKYDDEVSIITRMRDSPYVKIRLEYEIRRGETLLATARTSHAFIDRAGQPVKAPKFFHDAMAKHFPEANPIDP